MNTIDNIIQNLLNMPPNMSELKELKHETGMSLISNLCKIEERSKHQHIKKNKSTTHDSTGQRRYNPFSGTDSNPEFYYLPKKKPQQNAAIQPERENTFDPSQIKLANLLRYSKDNYDDLQIKSAIRVNSVLKFLTAKQSTVNPINEELEGLTHDDLALLDFLKKDEAIFLDSVGLWLSQEVGNGYFYSHSNTRYNLILNELVAYLGEKSVVENIMTLLGLEDKFLQFFEQLPIINSNVFYCLFNVIQILGQGTPIQSTVIALYKKLLEKFEKNTDAVNAGIQYLMDISIVETIKIVRNFYYSNDTFRDIIWQTLTQYLERLREPCQEKISDNYFKHFIAFAGNNDDFLKLLFEQFSAFDKDNKVVLVNKLKKFFEGRFKSIDSAQVELITTLFNYQNCQEMQEELQKFIFFNLPNMPLDQTDRIILDEVTKKFKRRKSIKSYSDLLMPKNAEGNFKVDGVITNLLHMDIAVDVLVYLHNMASTCSESTLVRLNEIIKKINDQFSYEKILDALKELCNPPPGTPISPITGVTLYMAAKKWSKPEDIKNFQGPYAAFYEKALQLLKNGGWQNEHVWSGVIQFLSSNHPWSKETASLVFSSVPMDFLMEAAEKDDAKRFKERLYKAKEAYPFLCS